MGPCANKLMQIIAMQVVSSQPVSYRKNDVNEIAPLGRYESSYEKKRKHPYNNVSESLTINSQPVHTGPMMEMIFNQWARMQTS